MGKIIDLYVLDSNLQPVRIIDNYYSLIWNHKYREVGDFEIALAATVENINAVEIGSYIARNDDDMVGVVKKIEIQTDKENGNSLIVTGKDVTTFLDQRVQLGVSGPGGTMNVENYIRQVLISNQCSGPADASRRFNKGNNSPLMSLGEANGFVEVKNEVVAYKNVGEIIRGYCKQYGWGYKLTWNRDDGLLEFNLYKGTDLQNAVRFSPKFDNLSTSKTSKDTNGVKNVNVLSYINPYSDEFVVGDYGLGGNYNLGFKSVDRCEFYTPTQNINRQITYSELRSKFPTGTVQNNIYIDYLRVQIFTLAQQVALTSEYSGTIDNDPNDPNVHYFHSNGRVQIAKLPQGSSADDPAILEPCIYDAMLLAAGKDTTDLFTEKTSFEGTVIPDVTYKYREDYNLGDIVSIENEYGIGANARIIEVLEVLDSTGYSIEPKFEYLAG